MYRNIFLVLMLVFCTSLLLAQLPPVAKDVSPLLIGEKPADVLVKNIDGESIKFSSVYTANPAIVIFYRGGWCPYCNKHLKEIGTIENELLELGYNIVAVSPDAPEKLSATLTKNEIRYTLISDDSGSLAREFGIAFQVPENYIKTVTNASMGSNTDHLPVPSVFILNTSGEIIFEYINPNYTKRLSAGLLLSVAMELQKD